ncbi:MAG: methyltransferase domain-containing protein, partial [Dehalococcoidia bacterium]
MTDPLDTIARYYDLDMGDYDADVSMYEGFARRLDAPVLELGVGTGRVAIPLARAGLSVVGIDSSAAMLAAALAKVDDDIVGRLRLVPADMRGFDLGRQFGLVFCALGGFCHLETVDDQLSALAGARRHLLPDGLLVVDLPAFDPSAWEPGARSLVHEWTRRHHHLGPTVSKFSSVEADLVTQSQRLTYIFDEVDEAGAVHRYTAVLRLRHVFRYEMEHLLARAGLRLHNVYGSYDLEAFDARSQRLIFVAGRGAEEPRRDDVMAAPVIALDGMGGDQAPAEIVKGAVQAARDLELDVALVGQPEPLAAELAKHGPQPPNLRLVPASEVIAMDEQPAQAARHKRDSSI